MKTAVEWLIDEIYMQNPDINIKRKEWMIDKAKEMEKEQIENAWDSAYTAEGFFNAEQYYNEIFKQEQ